MTTPLTKTNTFLQRWRSFGPVEEERETDFSLVHEHDKVMRWCLIVLTTLAIVVALWASKVVALPIVAGIIFGVVFGPITDRGIRSGVPLPAMAAVVTLCLLVFFVVIMGALAAPFALWIDGLPAILSTLRARLDDVMAYVRQFDGMASALTASNQPAVAVEAGSPLLSVALFSTSAAGGLLIFFGTMYFYLLSRRRLKARLLRLCLGTESRLMAGTIFEQIETRMAIYFAVVTVVNIIIGVLTALIVWLAGLPFALLWGVGAFLLNYIAFVGPALTTLLLLATGIAAQESLWLAIVPALAYFVIHTIESNFITPVLVGRRLTLSPFLIFLSFVFWLWLWGPVGAILSTPILLLGSVIVEQWTLRGEARPAGGDTQTVAKEPMMVPLAQPG
jgi:predicted PurR-regulated permease PerM